MHIPSVDLKAQYQTIKPEIDAAIQDVIHETAFIRGKYEIITMTLKRYLDHNYWTFDLFNIIGDTMINVNNKNNYPIMIQYLFRPNFKITDKISKEKMSEFQSLKPEELVIK